VKPATALIGSAALLTIGLWLLKTPTGPPSATPRATTTAAPAATSLPPTAVSSPLEDATSTPATNSTAPRQAAPRSAPADAGATAEAGAPAPADGPAGDPAIQTMLEHSVPANLPATLEHQLAQLGRQVWLADVIGTGRGQWPAYFTGPGSSGYTGVRVQAAIARATGTGAVTVTLLWAGTSPAGDVEVGLPGTVLLTQLNGGTWEPTR